MWIMTSENTAMAHQWKTEEFQFMVSAFYANVAASEKARLLTNWGEVVKIWKLLLRYTAETFHFPGLMLLFNKLFLGIFHHNSQNSSPLSKCFIKKIKFCACCTDFGTYCIHTCAESH